MKYTVKLTKIIVTEVEAHNKEEAVEMAREYDYNGWDGMWIHAEPEIQIIHEEN